MPTYSRGKAESGRSRNASGRIVPNDYDSVLLACERLLAIRQVDALIGLYQSGLYPHALDEARAVLQAAGAPAVRDIERATTPPVCDCGAKLSAGNQSGHCRPCATMLMWEEGGVRRESR